MTDTAATSARDRPTASPSRGTFWVVALGTAAFWMLVVWTIHYTSPRTLVSFHGFLHAAVAERLLSDLPARVPPENPFFAGEPLAYYWFFQFLAAQVTRLFGWNIFHSFDALLLATTGAVMILGVYLGGRLFRSLGVGVLIGYLIVAGTNPLGWLFGAIKLVVILWRTPQLVHADQSTYLWGVVHPLYSLIRFNDYGGLYGPLFNFFLNPTSRSPALAGALGVVCCLEWALRRPTLFVYVILAGASFLTTALSPLIGLGVAGTLVAGLFGGWLLGDRQAPVTPAASRAAIHGAAGVAIVAGALAASPTFYHLLTGPSDRAMRFWLASAAGWWHLATVTLSIGPLVALSLVGMRRANGARRPFLRILLLAAGLLLIADILVGLPAGNGSTFFIAAVAMLAGPAAGSVLDKEPSGASFNVDRRRAIAVVVFFLPTLLLLVAAYWHRPSLPADFSGTRLTRLPPDSDLASLYAWVQRDTAPDSIFVLDPRGRVAMCGNAPEFPAMTGRVLFVGELAHYAVEPYPDARRRVDLAVRLVSGEPAEPSDQAYLSRFRRPVYLVASSADDALVSRLRALYGAPAFRQGQIAVFRWSAARVSMDPGSAT